MARSPLYDIYDPYGVLQQQAELGMLPGSYGEGRDIRLSDLMPEEEKASRLQKLANVGSSGLGAFGWLLDTPGAVVRGTLSGGPLKGLSALWESSDDRVTGRELMRQYGMVGDEDSWSNWGAGLAGEILLDPLTYLNPLSILGRGAATQGGKALAKTGVLDDLALLAKGKGQGPRAYLRGNTVDDILTDYKSLSPSRYEEARQAFNDAAEVTGENVADLLSQRAAGSMEFRLPFTKRGTQVSLTGGRLGDYAASKLDALGEFAANNKFTAPVANRLTAFFDPSVRGAVKPEAQWRNREASAKARDAVAGVKGTLAELRWNAINATRDASVDGLRSFNDRRVQNAIADLIEAQGDASRVIDSEAVDAVLNTPEWNAFYEFANDAIPQAKARADEIGLELPEFIGADSTGFFPSQAFFFPTEKLPAALASDRLTRSQKPYSSSARQLATKENQGARNLAYDLPSRRQTFRQLMSNAFDAKGNPLLQGKRLQDELLALNDDDAIKLLEQAYEDANKRTGGRMGRLQGALTDEVAGLRKRVEESTSFDPSLPDFGASGTFADTSDVGKLIAARKRLRDRKLDLVNLLRTADTQFAENGMGIFDRSAFDDIQRYLTSRAGIEANADVIRNALVGGADPVRAAAVLGGGSVSLPGAAKQLGMNSGLFAKSLRREGMNPANMSVRESLVEELKSLRPQTGVPSDDPFSRLYRTFTNAFKVGALMNPAYHNRNVYSGTFSTLTQGFADPRRLLQNSYAGFQAGRGNYEPLIAEIRNVPRYKRAGEEVLRQTPAATQKEVDEGILRQFMVDIGQNPLGEGEVIGDIFSRESPSTAMFPGEVKPEPFRLFGKGGLLYDPQRKWGEYGTVRGVDWSGVLGTRRAPTETLNPFVKLHERAGQAGENFNRLGSYVAALQAGYSPRAAAERVFRGQVNYSPEAFSAGERTLRRFVPFYSYPRGITPLIAENFLYRPGGLQGQSIRAVTRGGQGDENFFVPEHLRQSAAVPVPWSQPGEGLQRFVTNIDLPYAGVLNMFSPGIGNSAGDILMDSARKTGMNLAGQLNPAIKMLAEGLFNRQLYSGRDLSDLYSVLEQDIGPIGRPIEQAVVNLVPGGTKLNSIYRTIRDDRLTPQDRLFKIALNNLAGFKVTDVDQERTKRLAARNALNQLLESTAGAKTYENITVPEDELRTMPERDRQLYLLYRILQSDAAKAARERKAAEAQDPLAILGVQ